MEKRLTIKKAEKQYHNLDEILNIIDFTISAFFNLLTRGLSPSSPSFIVLNNRLLSSSLYRQWLAPAANFLIISHVYNVISNPFLLNMSRTAENGKEPPPFWHMCLFV